MGDALFAELRAPVRRLAAPRIPVSYAAPLEDMARVTAADVAAAAHHLIRDRPGGKARRESTRGEP